MPDRAARLARLGTRLVSALAGLLMLALLLPGALAEAVEQTEQIDSGIEEDEVEKVGDIFDML